VTGRIWLQPFTLRECEAFYHDRNIEMTRYQMLESYMIFGGVPYYLDLFDRAYGFTHNVDQLCFKTGAPLANEYMELYCSLFGNAEMHIQIVETLASKQTAMTRKEIVSKGGLREGGHLSTSLRDLELCGFIEKYADFTRPQNGAYFRLSDSFTLFSLRYMKNNMAKDEYYWTNYLDDGAHRDWCGRSFEGLCLNHLPQIKKKLGISGVSTNVTAWRSGKRSPGAQIDLVIARKDGVINLCEMKYTKHPYKIDKGVADSLEKKKSVFIEETGIKDAIHITMVTTYGLVRSGYFGIAQSEVTMDDLFE
jgi:hypothetical protein